jgi:hypothetical protein
MALCFTARDLCFAVTVGGFSVRGGCRRDLSLGVATKKGVARGREAGICASSLGSAGREAVIGARLAGNRGPSAAFVVREDVIALSVGVVGGREGVVGDWVA